MTANWIKTSISTLVLLAVTASCAPRTFGPGVYHPSGRSDRTVSFAGDGTVVISHSSGNTEVEDDRDYFRVSGDRVILSDGRYCGSTDGTYTWRFDGNALKLTVLRDDRSDRKEVLTAAELLHE